jgi:hypothetical protein
MAPISPYIGDSVPYGVWFALRGFVFLREPVRLQVEKRAVDQDSPPVLASTRTRGAVTLFRNPRPPTPPPWRVYDSSRNRCTNGSGAFQRVSGTATLSKLRNNFSARGRFLQVKGRFYRGGEPTYVRR